MAESTPPLEADPKQPVGNGKGRPRRSRPNYRHIHRLPLPLPVHPLPPLIPHNPLSVISIALSYLTFFISPPPQKPTYSAYFDSATSSVHVTDPKTIRALWEMGFFGKGSLSRSEPSWMEREKKRRGLLGVDTSEEATKARRVERRGFKLERARKEKEAIAERLKEESLKSNGQAGEDPTTDKVDIVNAATDITVDETVEEKEVTPAVQTQPANNKKSVRFAPLETEATSKEPGETSPVQIEEEEHLQLSNEEAFFLAYGLGILNIYNDARTAVLPAPSLLKLFRQHSYSPPCEPSAVVEPDDRFMLPYVAYHHFRSLGWVVRSGVKFGVDLLLYNRGPVFSHAEFAVILVPSYRHPYWTETQEGQEMLSRKPKHDWWWLHGVNRVQAQVQKTLVLCYIEVPRPDFSCHDTFGAEETDIGALLKTYKVREFALKRWVPNRSRD